MSLVLSFMYGVPSLSMSSPAATPLTMADHKAVSQCLDDLTNEDLIVLGTELGLKYPRLKRMRFLLGDMVAAWLNREDYVLASSGPPSWASLMAALRNIGMIGIATAIQSK